MSASGSITVELHDRLDAGGMAEVFRGEIPMQESGNIQVAVKRILPHLALDSEFRQVFERELKLISQLRHPNIVEVRRLGYQHDSLYLVMEYIEGKSINDILLQCQKNAIILPVPIACHLASEIAAGLGYAFEGDGESRSRAPRIIHRDVNPRNIMVGYNGAVKIIDFGIAKALNQSQTHQSYGFRGTYGYCSPEQVLNLPLDGRTDVFSLGIILWEMLAQRPLFTGQPHEIVQQVIKKAPRPPGDFRSDLPQELELLVMRALVKDTEYRLSSALELHQGLKRILQHRYPKFDASRLQNFMTQIFADEIRLARGKTLKDKEAVQILTLQSAPLTGRKPGSMKRTGIIALLLMVVVGLVISSLHLIGIGAPKSSPDGQTIKPPEPILPDTLGDFALRVESLGGLTGTPVGRWISDREPTFSAKQPTLSLQPVLIRESFGKRAAVRFDGVNDALTLGEFPWSDTEAISVLWFGNLYSLNTPQVIWSFQGQGEGETDMPLRVMVHSTSDGGITLFVQQGSLERNVTLSNVLRSGRFQPLGFTIAKEEVSLYAEGQKKSEKLMEALDLISVETLLVGASTSAGAHGLGAFNGSIVELVVLPRAIDPEEFQTFSESASSG